MESGGRFGLVWFDLLEFARLHHVLARIGFPFVGLFQRKFAADAQRAILEAVYNQ